MTLAILICFQTQSTALIALNYLQSISVHLPLQTTGTILQWAMTDKVGSLVLKESLIGNLTYSRMEVYL